jgi:hypothetical protein
MPVEVREIVIKGIVTEGEGVAGSPAPGSGQPQKTEEIIKACVEMVLQILKEKTER